MYHCNQSINSSEFFQFIAYRIRDTPFDIDIDIIKQCNESDNLNLVLNAKFSHKIWLFLMKQPIYIKQQFENTEYNISMQNDISIES